MARNRYTVKRRRTPRGILSSTKKCRVDTSEVEETLSGAGRGALTLPKESGKDTTSSNEAHSGNDAIRNHNTADIRGQVARFRRSKSIQDTLIKGIRHAYQREKDYLDFMKTTAAVNPQLIFQGPCESITHVAGMQRIYNRHFNMSEDILNRGQYIPEEVVNGRLFASEHDDPFGDLDEALNGHLARRAPFVYAIPTAIRV